MTRVASFVVLLGILAVIIVAFYRVMADFLLPLFIAAFLVVVFRPVYQRISEKLGDRKRLAALLTTVLVILIVLLPTLAVGSAALLEGAHVISDLNITTSNNPLARMREAAGIELSSAEDLRSVESALREMSIALRASDSNGTVDYEISRIRRHLAAVRAASPSRTTKHELEALIARVERWPETENDITLDEEVANFYRDFRQWKIKSLGGTYRAYLVGLANPSDDQWRQLTNSVVSSTQPLLVRFTRSTSSAIGSFLLSSIITVVALYFFLCDGSTMVETVMRLSPLDDRYEKELLDEFVGISRAVLLATLLSAGAQALLAGVGYWFAGVEAVFLLMVLTGILAMIPLVGTFGVWGPVCVWIYFVEGRPVAAIVLAVYCAAIVSTADNVIKPAVLHGQSRLHPLLALLSVLGGVKMLGPIGILVGPMVVVFLQTLLNILHRELLHFESAGKDLSVLATGAGIVGESSAAIELPVSDENAASERKSELGSHENDQSENDQSDDDQSDGESKTGGS